MTPTEILQAELDTVIGDLQQAEADLTQLTEEQEAQVDWTTKLSRRKLELELAIAKLSA